MSEPEQTEDLETLLSELSERERRFCDEWVLTGGNGTQSAENAGFGNTKDACAVAAYRLLRKDKIKAVLTWFQEHDPKVPARQECLQILGSTARGEIPEWRVGQDGGLIELPASPAVRMEAVMNLSKLRGDIVSKVANTNAAGEDIKQMGNAELMALVALGKGIE